MGLIFCDGFDSYAATADLTKKWGSAGSPWTWGATLGRNGGGGVSCVAGAAAATMTYTSTAAFGDITTGIFHFGLYAKFTNAVPANLQPFLVLADTTATAAGVCAIGIQNNLGAGVIQLINGNGSFANVGGTRNVCDGNWHWIEVQINLSGNQLQRIFIDNTFEAAAVVTINNQGRLFHGLTLKQMNNGIGILGLDDPIVYDNNGFSPIASDYPIGQALVGVKRPSGDNSIQFTPDTGGTNFSRVNEVNGDGDASYVESGVLNAQDFYTFTALGGTPGRIWSAMLNSYVEDPVGGTQNYRANCKSSATTANGATVALPTTYRTLQQPFNVDPNGNAIWTQSALDAAFFGPQVQ